MQPSVTLRLNETQQHLFLGSLLIHDAVDLGPCIVQHGTHPDAGECTLVSTIEANAALIIESSHQAAVRRLLSL